MADGSWSILSYVYGRVIRFKEYNNPKKCQYTNVKYLASTNA